MPGAMVLVVIHDDEEFRQFSSSVGSCLLPGLSGVDKETSLRRSSYKVRPTGQLFRVRIMIPLELLKCSTRVDFLYCPGSRSVPGRLSC
jgi:hypothetical protein